MKHPISGSGLVKKVLLDGGREVDDEKRLVVPLE
jgi:hypothetical protein